MAIGLYYTMEFKNTESVSVKVLIGDNSVVADTPQIISLDPAGSPLRLGTIDNEENKFSPIKAQQATITFLSNSETSLQTFADGADDRFSVSILYGTTIIFYGFLSLADNSEAFLPVRNEVTLTANDKLGALKDIALTDFDGENPQGKYKIGVLIAMCLQKTGLSLPLRVINNLRHGTGTKTFQATFGSPSDPFIIMDNANASFFYVGQRVLVSGTASNNVEFTVISVGTGFVGAVGADEDFTLEADIVATFTDTSSADHIYKGTFLDAKTFEQEIGVSINCEDALRKIFGYALFVTQYKECWWICRVDEYDEEPFYVSRFDENGEYVDSYVESNLIKNIGFNETHWLSDEATAVLPTRPVGFVKLTYNYAYPQELVCNKDFSRGTGAAIDDTSPNETIEYTLDCWEFLREGSAPDILDEAPSVGSIGILNVRYEYGYEKERYIITKTAGGFRHYFKSEFIPVLINEKIRLSVDWRTENDEAITNVNMVHVRLIADNGDIYDWEYDKPTDVGTWTQKVVTDAVFDTTWRDDVTGLDSTEWRSISNELAMPASGKLYIRLLNQEADTIKIYFSNLDVTSAPYINGSYKVYNGRYEKVTNTTAGYLANVDDEVFMADAQSKLLKGAMFFLANGEYTLTVKWYDGSNYALGSPTDLTLVQPYGWHQVYAVWNQNRLANRIFQFQVQGFGDDIPSLVHEFLITDVSGHSNNRSFLMLTKEADLFLCSMAGTLEQVFHTTELKEYDTPHEFKYIS